MEHRVPPECVQAKLKAGMRWLVGDSEAGRQPESERDAGGVGAAQRCLRHSPAKQLVAEPSLKTRVLQEGLAGLGIAEGQMTPALHNRQRIARFGRSAPEKRENMDLVEPSALPLGVAWLRATRCEELPRAGAEEIFSDPLELVKRFESQARVDNRQSPSGSR